MHFTGSGTRRSREPRVRQGALGRHRFGSLVELLEDDPSFVSRAMFGCVGCYLGGRLVVVLADRGEPWQGLLVPVERAVHAELRRELAALRIHPVLGKWLYLPEADRQFAAASRELVRRIAEGDPRFGVDPAPPRLPRRTGAAFRRPRRSA